jgi:hypothetical protein
MDYPTSATCSNSCMIRSTKAFGIQLSIPLRSSSFTWAISLRKCIPSISREAVSTKLTARAYENRPDEPYPNSNDIIIGVCLGELSATAVSQSKSLLELIPLAVQVVRVAFKVGMLSSTVGNGLERRAEPAGCWSATISRECGLDDEAELQAVAAGLGLLGNRQPYITAFSSRSITLSAPPSSLQKLLDHLQQSDSSSSLGPLRPVRIYSPYHAPHYFPRADIRRLLDDDLLAQAFPQTPFPSHSKTFMGSADGNYHHVSSRAALLECAVYNILAQPIRWDEITTACKELVEKSDIAHWTLRPFGQPSLAKALVSSFGSMSKSSVEFDDEFGSQPSNQPKARQIPIAIVGMAGRFPKAEDPDALWELLKAGIDCHSEIPLDRFDPKTHLKQRAFGCFLDGPGLFDARFFNMSPREALQTDPGQRLALVTAYEALEDAGFVPNRTPSTRLERVGTFNGQVVDEYKEQNMAQDVGTYFIPGSMRAFATVRLAFPDFGSRH